VTAARADILGPMKALPRAVAVLTTAVLALLTVGVTAQVPASRPRITGIDHLVFRASDAAAARGFYSDVLGLRPGAGPSGRLQFNVGDRQAIYVDPDLPAGEDERLRLLAFATPDLKELTAHLTAKGIAVTRVTGPGAAAITVSDPDGHPLAFVQRSFPPEPFLGMSGTSHGPQPPAPLSTRILHAGLTIRDEAAATRFYKDILGFGEIWRGGRSEGVTDWINMRVPDGTDYLEYMLVTAPPDRRQRGVLHHVALLVPDIQAAWEAAAARTPAADRARLEAPRVGRNGRWQLNLYDGDGTRTELMEPFTVR
jgi:catechol 2,3-dioxygenase-like lactoylglutathione lyase family enzyme